MQMDSKIPEPVIGNGSGIAARKSPGDASEKKSSAVSREFHNLVADVEELITATTALSAEELMEVKAKLGQSLAAAKASVEDIGGAVTERARKVALETDGYVHQQPWAAIGMGAAAGFLLGLVVARSR